MYTSLIKFAKEDLNMLDAVTVYAQTFNAKDLPAVRVVCGMHGWCLCIYICMCNSGWFFPCFNRSTSGPRKGLLL